MIVCDLGCRTYGEDESIGPLRRHYKPDVLYGFDPLLPEWVQAGTGIVLKAKAAWIWDGTVPLGIGAAQELDATPVRQKNDRDEWAEVRVVPCFDLAEWLKKHGPCVVKMNVEGAEFALLERLIQTGTEGLLTELVVAWHDERLGPAFTVRREEILAQLACPVLPWTLDFGKAER